MRRLLDSLLLGSLVLGSLLVLASASACVSPEARVPVALAEGERDLRCERSKLSARQLGDRLFEVTGCGQRAVYRVICKLTVGSCYPLKQ